MVLFKGVKLTSEQITYIQALADEQFEGNFSMALRCILTAAMSAAK